MPNPATTYCQIQLSFKQQQSFELHVYDLHGKLLQQYTYEGQVQTIPVDVSRFASGVYVLELQMEGGRAFRKLVIR
jgi:hypothetical protein